MRFTTGQEPGDRAELGHDRLPDNLDESMMAASGCTEPVDSGCVDEGSMISNLPLLFADGYPTSLEKITLPQLEKFITFMVQCSFGHDTAKVIKEPQWWPKEIQFTNPFVRPKKVNENWMGNLKKLVFRCYTYHRSEYLLRFCSHLAQHPRDKLEYVDNWDSTTSLYHKSTGKLLVTFRNENMNYDKKIESPRRLLLPRNGAASSTSGKSKRKQQLRSILQPVLCDDIYLCDNCDAEFDGYKKMKEHEKECCDQEQSSGSSRPVSPDISLVPQACQNQFLEYFSLSSKSLPEKSIDDKLPKKNLVESGIRSSRRIRGSVNLARCPTIPFSSPAGIAMAKKSRVMTEVTQQERLERIERYLIAPPIINGSRPRWLDRVNDASRWIVSHKPNRDKPAQDDYVHEYKFNSFRGKPILNIRSQILCIACRMAIIPVTLLTEEMIEELKKNPDLWNKYDDNLPNRRNFGGGEDDIENRRRTRPAPKSKRRIFNNHGLNPNKKRKNPGHHPSNVEPIIIDEEVEELATLTPILPPRKISPIDGNFSLELSTSFLRSPRAKRTKFNNDDDDNEAADGGVSRVDDDFIELSSIPFSKDLEYTKNDKTHVQDITQVAFIDLCSSSDEEDNIVGDNGSKINSITNSDENRDPMMVSGNSNHNNLTSTILTNFIPNKIHVGSCVYPVESKTDWLKRISEPCQSLFE